VSRSDKQRPTISQPTPDVNSLAKVATELKEGYEMLSGQRGDPEDRAVTWRDLLNLKLVQAWQVPKQ